MTPVAALAEIEVLIRRLEEGDLLADLHEEAMPALADAEVEFAVHDPDSGLRERERVLSSVRRGLRTLTNAPGSPGSSRTSVPTSPSVSTTRGRSTTWRPCPVASST